MRLYNQELSQRTKHPNTETTQEFCFNPTSLFIGCFICC